MNKFERQGAILRLVGERELSTQSDVVDALRDEGLDAVQATVSRDIAQLGLGKEADALGRPRYVLPAERPRRGDPREAVQRILREFGRSATPAQNLVVLVSELGSAPAIARALDRLAHPKVVGTLAGDDTVLVIARNAADARALAAELSADLPED
jgi:transcriptional regulator of arginine metabolism